MTVYPTAELWNEVSYLAYHLHWQLDDLLDLEHGDRTRLVVHVADLNERALQA